MAFWDFVKDAGKSVFGSAEAAEAKASGMAQPSKDRLMGAMRENLARRIERGEQIPAPKQTQQLVAATVQAGPER